MTGRPEIAEEGKETQFTSENQPSQESKSEGAKEWWNRKKLAENQLAEFSKPIAAKSGLMIQPHEQAMSLMKKAFFSDESKLSDKEKIELYLKFCAQVGIETKDINLEGLNVTIAREDAAL